MCQDEGQGALWTVGTSQVPETSPFGDRLACCTPAFPPGLFPQLSGGQREP